jgi:hypothetical protein
MIIPWHWHDCCTSVWDGGLEPGTITNQGEE